MSEPATTATSYPQPLECLIKPRFSCGQLLSDQDLSALVTWTEAKSNLVRYRQGWGVASGLGVSSAGKGNQLVLNPGYAVDQSGRDIVVGAGTVIDLDVCYKSDPTMHVVEASEPREPFDFVVSKMQNIEAIDLVLHYAEVGASPRATLGGVQCGGSTVREYARLQQTYRVECMPGKRDMDPMSQRAHAWKEQYKKCFAILRRYREEASGLSGADLQRWVLAWVKRNPLRSLCFLGSWLRETPAEAWNEELVTRALFWLIQDRRIAFLQAEGSDAAPETGVPLARVWVHRPAAERKFQLMAIDALPPYRRPLEEEDRWIAPSGCINGAQAFWRSDSDAQALLRRQGVRLLESEPYEIPGSVGALEEHLEKHNVMLEVDRAFRLRVFDTGNFVYRVIGIDQG